MRNPNKLRCNFKNLEVGVVVIHIRLMLSCRSNPKASNIKNISNRDADMDYIKNKGGIIACRVQMLPQNP